MDWRDRWRSLAAVAAVHLGLAYALLYGLSVQVQRSTDAISRLIAVELAPPVPVVPIKPKKRSATQSPSAPVAARDAPGGSTGPSKVVVPTPVAPIVAIAPTASPGGSLGYGALAGSGSGGGTGGQGTGTGDGNGDGDGGVDLQWLSGSFRSSDYPSAVRAGGRVEFRYIVGVTGRVTSCGVTQSSGNADLDGVTCRVVIKRFRYRPSTDANGRPIPAIVEGEVDWNDLSRAD